MCPPLVRVDNLGHAYPDGRVALAGVSFTLGPSERVGLLGANGAGKTTLFLRLAGVLPGAPGQARVAGLDPAIPADRRQLPARLGLVFQNPDDQLFAPTVLEDVAFAPLNLGHAPAAARALAMAALERVGLAGAAERSPHRLSGGEKRRAALAGVLALAPDLLLLDEPTMFLDAPSRRGLRDWLRGWPGAFVIATHDLALVRELCPRILLLDAGRLVADAPAVLLDDPAWLAARGLD